MSGVGQQRPVLSAGQSELKLSTRLRRSRAGNARVRKPAATWGAGTASPSTIRTSHQPKIRISSQNHVCRCCSGFSPQLVFRAFNLARMTAFSPCILVASDAHQSKSIWAFAGSSCTIASRPRFLSGGLRACQGFRTLCRFRSPTGTGGNIPICPSIQS